MVEQTERKERALFLDRDGVINVEVSYLIHAKDLRFVPGIFSLCRTAKSLGYRIIVVTNQAGIGRGVYTEEEFHTLMAHIQTELAREGVAFDAVYHSPWHPKHGFGKYKRDHEDRKPNPGMLLRAVREFGVSLADSVMVGDRCTDVGAANNASVKQAFLLAGVESDCAGRYQAVESLAEVEAWLIANG